jgi:hypothetical protein
MVPQRITVVVLRMCAVLCIGVAAVASVYHVQDWLGVADAQAAQVRSPQAGTPGTTQAMPDRAKAVRALGENPLDHRALAQLMQAQLMQVQQGSGDQAAADRSLALLGALTRRSPDFLRTELAQATQTASLERVVVVLDRLASQSPAEQRTILPLLAIAIGETGAPGEPSGAELIAARQTRPWYPAMIAAGARDPETLGVLSAFLLDHRPPDAALRGKLLKAVVKGYLARSDFAGAGDFAARFGPLPGAARRDLGWAPAPAGAEDLPLFWQFPSPQAELVRNAAGDWRLAVSGLPEAQVLAEKLFVVEPEGVFRIDADVMTDTADDPPVMWQVRCGQRLLRQARAMQRKTATTRAQASVEFASGSSCSSYTVTLLGDPLAAGAAGQRVEIGSPHLQRVR